MNSKHRTTKIASLILSRHLVYAFVGVVSIGWGAKASAQQAPPLGQTITVPLDYKTPNLGSRSLYFEFGAPYEGTKPTVFIIADAQQFYVRRGEVPNLQRALSGDAFNVIGIVGRGSSQEFI